MAKELTQRPEPKRKESTEVAKPLRPDQLPIARHKEAFLDGLPEPLLAEIEQGINALVEPDDVKERLRYDTVTAAIFFATRKAHRENRLGMEPVDLVGKRLKETRWGKRMLAQVGMDLDDGLMKVTIRTLLARDSKSNEVLQAGMRSAALYLKSIYGWDKIPEYTVEGKGVSHDDIVGHDPEVKEARRLEIEKSKPPKTDKK